MRRDPLDAVFEAVARADFLPARLLSHAREDRALPLCHGSSNSQPSTVRAMLRLLDVRPGQSVLDVGSGSGWTTALLAHLVGPSGSVTGVEVVPDLVADGRRNLAAYAFGWAEIVPAVSDTLGFPDRAPFDRILVSAAARDVPRALVDQLVTEGVMVVPVRGSMVVVRRSAGSAEPFVVRKGHYRFVPLVVP